MSDLAAALDELLASPRPGGLACPVATYLASLAARDAALHARVVSLIDNPDVQSSGLAAALAKDGGKFTAASLRRHRKRGTGGDACRCAR